MTALLLWVLACASVRAEPAPRDLLESSAAAQVAGDADRAWALASQAARQAPQNPAVLTRASSAALASRRFAEAAALATVAMAKGGATPALYQTRSAALQAQGRTAEALADAEAGLRLNPNSADGLLRRAQAREGAGRRAAALDDFRRAAEIDRALDPINQLARARLGAGPATPPWAWLAGVLLGIAATFLFFRKGHRSRVVRFGSVIRVPPQGDEPKPGRVLAGRFIIGSAVDRSPSGQTFEGRDLEDHPIVIRRYLPSLEPRKRFTLARAQAAGKIKHAGLVPLEAVFEENAGAWGYAVTAVVEGATLAGVLERASGRRLPPESVLRGCRSLCEALDAAHAAGSTHGRVGPQEIMVCGDAWLLSGLGLPGSAGADSVPPEGDEPSKEGDLYGLGVTLYEALSGERPFTGAEATLAKSEGRPASLAGRVGLPAGLDAFFARALQPDPARRFRSAVELSLALRNLVAPAVH